MDANQCDTTDDCALLGDSNPAFVGTTCSVDGICVHPGQSGTGASGGAPGSCVSAEQCTADNNGVPSICRPTGCVKLLNDDCDEVKGDYKHPDAVLIGFLNSAPFGPLPDQFQHLAHLCVIDQILDEIESNVGGIPHPSGSGLRPVAFISCNEKCQDVPNNECLTRVGEHLINEVGVKSLVGGTFNVSAGFENDMVIPNDVTHIIPSIGLASFMDLNDPNNLIWTTIPNYANLSIAVGRTLEAADAWLKEADPMLDRVRVALWANQDGDTQMAQYGIDTDRFIFNGQPANGQDPPDADCPDGCFKYYQANQFVDGEGNIDWGVIVPDMIAFNPHIIVILDTDSSFSLDALPQLEALDNVKPDPIYILRNGDPSTSITLATVLQDPPKPDTETRFYATNYKYEKPEMYSSFQIGFGAICPALVPPQSLFFPPFIEFTYDALHLAVMAHLANGNHTKHGRDLTGAELSAGMLALAPLGQRNPAQAEKVDIKGANLGKIYNDLVAGSEIDVFGVSGALDFTLEWKSPVMNMDVVCVQHGSDFPNTAAYGPSGVYWDALADTLIQGLDRQYFVAPMGTCLPLAL